MEEDATGFDPNIWKQICGFGWAGILIPEEFGGSGGDLTDMVSLYEEIGRAILPSPLFASGVEATTAILAGGSDAQKKDLLPGIADGSKIYTFGLTEETGTYEPWGVEAKAEKKGDGYVLNGTKLYVHNANVADGIIVAARTGEGDSGIGLFIVDPKASGVKITILDTIFQDHQYVVELNNVEVGAGDVLGGGWATIQKVIDTASVILAAECVGGAERSLELAVDYSKRRIAFGRPIGAFQALQHKMARMVTEMIGSQLTVYEAAYKISQGDDASLEVPIAKAAASTAYTTCSIEGCHIFGGNGFIKESDMQLYYRRAKVCDVLYGDPRWQNKKIVAAMAAMPAPAAH
jgi:alkylation response protein AidB-like acyl-CoA dehydrogenase